MNFPLLAFTSIALQQVGETALHCTSQKVSVDNKQYAVKART